MQPSIWGKLKANVQFLAVLLAIWRPGEPIGEYYLDQYVMVAAAVITVLSGDRVRRAVPRRDHQGRAAPR